MAESQSTATPPSSFVNGHGPKKTGPGYPKSGIHWTQTAAGKKKLAAVVAKGVKTRKANQAGAARPAKAWAKPGKKSYGGKHWTQLPGGKEKMRAIQLARTDTQGKTPGAVKYAKGKRDVIALAVIGARQQLAWHISQVSKLKIFLSVNSKRVEADRADE